MIDTLNVYINKAKQEDKTPKQVKNSPAEEFGEKNKKDDDEMDRSNHLSNNMGFNEHSDITPVKSDNTNVLNRTNKTDIQKAQRDGGGGWANVTDDDISKNQKSAYTSVWTYADRSMITNKSQMQPWRSRDCPVFGESPSRKKLNLNKVDKNQTLRKSLLNSIDDEQSAMNRFDDDRGSLKDIGFTS